MPVMDGFTLCRQWMADSQLKDIPFVFYTATYTDAKDEDFALSLGATRFIIKPMEPDLFIEVIRDVLKNHQTGRLTPPPEVQQEETIDHRNQSGNTDALVLRHHRHRPQSKRLYQRHANPR